MFGILANVVKVATYWDLPVTPGRGDWRPPVHTQHALDAQRERAERRYD